MYFDVFSLFSVARAVFRLKVANMGSDKVLLALPVPHEGKLFLVPEYTESMPSPRNDNTGLPVCSQCSYESRMNEKYQQLGETYAQNLRLVIVFLIKSKF